MIDNIPMMLTVNNFFQRLRPQIAIAVFIIAEKVATRVALSVARYLHNKCAIDTMVIKPPVHGVY
jgi:hypothetical protein